MPSLAPLRGRGGNPGAGLEPAGGAGEGTALKMKGLGCRRAITGDARGGAARFVAERLQVVTVVPV